MDKEQYIILSILFFIMYFPGTFAIGYALGMRANRHDRTRKRFED